MRIVLYSQNIRKVSGLTTFERIFIKEMSKFHEIVYMYKTADPQSMEAVSDYCQLHLDDSKPVSADICIYSSLQHGYPAPNVIAKKYIQVVHADIKAAEKHYQINPKIDIYVAVGKSVQKALKEDFNIDSIVIPNMLEMPTPEKVVRFMTASRIAEGKGFERIVKMAKIMKQQKRRFNWEIYGEGAMSYINTLKYDLAGVNEVVFMGSRDNIQSYMLKNDYVVQLSDNEGFCYSIHEALQVGVPVIATRFEGIEDIIQDGVNGYLIDLDLNCIDFDAIYNQLPKCDKLGIDKTIEKWFNIF